MRIQQKILSLGIAIILLGCGGEKEDRSQPISQKTKEALGDKTNESGCDGNDAEESEGCSEDSSSSFILNALENSNETQKENNSLRGQLNTPINDMSQDEKKENSSKNDLESLVNQVGELMEKDSNNVAEGLESLVDSYDKQEHSKSIQEELTNLVKGVESSKLKREEVEAKLLSLVGEVENKKLKREEVEEKLLALVGDVPKVKKQSLKQTQLNLESLVSSAKKEGTNEAKRLASSIIEDVSQKRIKILRTEDTFVVIQVQNGDSLSELAKKYYGDATKYKIIYEANKDKIGNRNTIYPGTTLVIPKI